MGSQVAKFLSEKLEDVKFIKNGSIFPKSMVTKPHTPPVHFDP